MDTLIYTLGVVVFFVGLMASIGLHEVGHMWPAKRFGVLVTEYFIGFGGRVWSWRRGETEYGIKAIPLGGYVKLVGMLPPAKDAPSGDGDADHPQRVRPSNTGMFTQLVADARATEYEKVRPGDEDRLFYRRPWWQKLIIMVGGPAMNIVIAAVLFSILIIGIGTLGRPTTTVDEVSDCVIPAADAGRACTSADEVTPAVRAGLQPGDVITSFNGTPVDGWDQLTALIRDNADGSAAIGIERDGEPMTLHTDTTVSARPVLDHPEQTVDVGFLGVSPVQPTVHGTPLDVAREMGTVVRATGVAIVHLPERMGGVVQAAFGGARADNSPMSVVGASRVAGELASDHAFSWRERIAQLVGLLAVVNLFVALFNFIPLLPLDGGHIAGALYEAVRRGVARLRGRPDPGYVDVAKLLPLAYAVGMILVLMGVLLVYADIVNPVQLQ